VSNSNNILLLGGITEARLLLEKINSITGFNVVYSTKTSIGPSLQYCTQRFGGFGGIDGLEAYLAHEAIGLIIDCTHPYAAQISNHAFAASQHLTIPYLQYLRPAWDFSYNKLTCIDSFIQLHTVLEKSQRIFFTIGEQQKTFIASKPVEQIWWWRSAVELNIPEKIDNFTSMVQRGPFSYADELSFLKNNKVDTLVCKNSGGQSVFAKIQAAMDLKIDIVMLARPPVVQHEFLFTNITALASKLKSYRSTN